MECADADANSTIAARSSNPPAPAPASSVAKSKGRTERPKRSEVWSGGGSSPFCPFCTVAGASNSAGWSWSLMGLSAIGRQRDTPSRACNQKRNYHGSAHRGTLLAAYSHLHRGRSLHRHCPIRCAGGPPAHALHRGRQEDQFPQPEARRTRRRSQGGARALQP